MTIDKKIKMGVPQKDLVTSCDGCVFRAMSGKYQVGCLAHDISYQDYDVKYNNNFRFKNKVCQFKRTEDWSSKRDGTDLYEEVRKEVRLSYTYVFESDSISDISKKVENLNKASLPPRQLICYVPHDEVFISEARNNLFATGYKNWLLAVNGIPQERDNVHDCLANYRANTYVFAGKNDIHPEFFNWLDCQRNDFNLYYSIIGGEAKILSRVFYDTLLLPIKELEQKFSKINFEDLYNHFYNERNWSERERKFC